MYRFFWLILGMLLLLTASAGASEISPDMALQLLQEGNARFVTGQSIHPNQDAARRLVTSTLGQKPFATILACSDSRVPVEILFDQGIGDLFVVKVAGNVADTDEIGSMEYGVDHLGTPVLVVLGHTLCGAVTAVTRGDEVHGSIPQLVDNIVPALESVRHAHPELEGSELVVAVIEANVWQSIADILRRSPAIAARVAMGEVAVVGAMYDIRSGEVRFLGPHPQQAELIPQVLPEGGHAAPATHPTTTSAHTEAPKVQQAAAVHAEAAPAGHGAPAPEAAHEKSSGGFGFFSFLVFVAALIGVVILLDKTILRPEE